VSNTVFSCNAAETGDASCIYLLSGTEFSVSLSEFSESYAKSRGSIYVAGTAFSLEESTFTYNIASEICSLLFLHSGSVALNSIDLNSTFADNLTVVYVLSSGTFSVRGYF
jgi:hypothetical protein